MSGLGEGGGLREEPAHAGVVPLENDVHEASFRVRVHLDRAASVLHMAARREQPCRLARGAAVRERAGAEQGASHSSSAQVSQFSGSLRHCLRATSKASPIFIRLRQFLLLKFKVWLLVADF